MPSDLVVVAGNYLYMQLRRPDKILIKPVPTRKINMTQYVWKMYGASDWPYNQQRDSHIYL